MPPVMRIVRRLTILTIIFIASAAGIFWAVRSFTPSPDADAVIEVDPDTRPITSSEGGAQFRYRVPPDKVPQTHDERLVASSFTLIPGRQQEPVSPIVTTARERAPIADLVDGFIPAWETYAPREPEDSYRQRIQRYAVPGATADMTKREGANQPAGIGTCDTCTTGSRFTSGISPSDFLQVRALDGNTAYVTTQGVIAYTGGSRSGQTARRTYALVLERSSGEWKVARIVADTLSGE